MLQPYIESLPHSLIYYIYMDSNADHHTPAGTAHAGVITLTESYSLGQCFPLEL